MTKSLPIILIAIVCLAFTATLKDKTVKYMPLGDSYTIGTGATPAEAWPTVLTKNLNDAGIKTELLGNPARNGFSTQNLIDIELPEFDKSDANFVTIQIGVNDWVREVSTTNFETNLAFILDHVQKKLKDKKKILLVTIPDFGVTPTGANYSKGRNISSGLTEFNDIIKAQAAKRDLTCVDIFAMSQKMKDNPLYTAADGLHPSAREYGQWLGLIFPAAKTVLEK
jgi:acyl-CoA thioesterase-1